LREAPAGLLATGLVSCCPLIRATGITQLGLPWLLGGYDWAGSTNQIFHGFIGDVRIVNRPLRAGEFMIAT
jgi:hypothetical protein